MRWRSGLLGMGALLTALAALDLGARVVLGRDLVMLARSSTERAAAVPPTNSSMSEGVLVTTVESPRFSILAVASPDCAHGPSCPIALTIEPAPGRRLVVDAPYAFLGTPSPAVAYDGPPGKIRATERSLTRAVIHVPARLLRDGSAAPGAIEGRVRIYSCDAETCVSEIAPVTVALPPRHPAG